MPPTCLTAQLHGSRVGLWRDLCWCWFVCTKVLFHLTTAYWGRLQAYESVVFNPPVVPTCMMLLLAMALYMEVVKVYAVFFDVIPGILAAMTLHNSFLPTGKENTISKRNELWRGLILPKGIAHASWIEEVLASPFFWKPISKFLCCSSGTPTLTRSTTSCSSPGEKWSASPGPRNSRASSP